MAYQINCVNPFATINTANINTDGTGTIGHLMTANGTFGNMVDNIRIQSIGAVSNGMVRLFIKDTGAWEMIKEIPVVVSTGSNPPLEVYGLTITPNIYLKPGVRLGISTYNADTFRVVAFSYEINGFI